MRVEWIGLEDGGRHGRLSLSTGKEYVVEMMIALRGRQTEITFTTDSGRPTQLPAQLFRSTEGTIPSNWVTLVDQDGNVQLGPASWLRSDFWLDFWGDEGQESDVQQAAREAYAREREIILGEDEATRRP
jgi:hypothetical protein